MDKMPAMSFPQAMKHFFGDNPNKDALLSPAMAFMKELKMLDGDDKVFFRKELERVGYTLT